ncbi:ImmA/IrrE family metallo-endopeptidase [Nocardia nova]|uniref:ImmA/IrrE family metallo-endopeptidase n=1 Tax=Nocardia nova TaxID=37330 RepID=UPI001C44047E|nr:ImmA/IrrE family metallo-endopeptidase [Nocardia nova]MBV7706846.1 ImmA/IrrE family metallo-endopeptidase [Nocardia nova]
MSEKEWEAHKRRRMLISNRKRTYQSLQSHEYGAISLASIPEGVSITDLVEAHTEAVFEQIVVPEQYQKSMREVSNRIFTVHAESDAVSASTRSFSDGSHLIAVSDATFTLCAHLSELLEVWRKKYRSEPRLTRITGIRSNRRLQELDKEAQIIKAGAAALRYYLLHQRTLGQSAKVGPTRNENAMFQETPEFNLYIQAESFILAHELGHILLGHTAFEKSKLSKDEQHRMEFEADTFAVACAQAAGHPRNVVVSAAMMAIIAIALSSEPLFIRMPELHPFSGDRFDRIIFSLYPKDTYPSATVARELHISGAIEMAREAARIWKPLPEEFWNAMIESNEINTSIHSSAYYTLVRGIDLSLGFSARQVADLIVKFRDSPEPEWIAGRDEHAILQALREIERNEIATGLNSLRTRNFDRILSVGSPLSWHSLTESLLGQSTALGPSPNNKLDIARATAAMITHLIGPHL